MISKSCFQCFDTIGCTSVKVGYLASKITTQAAIKIFREIFTWKVTSADNRLNVWKDAGHAAAVSDINIFAFDDCTGQLVSGEFTFHHSNHLIHPTSFTHLN